MAYNTGSQKHKSTNLEALDCGHNVKHVPVDDNFPDAVFTASSTRVVGVGECVAMIRVPANTVILGADFYWNDTAPAAVVAIGDPFGCARILGPILMGDARGFSNNTTHLSCSPWGSCASLNRMGTEGDGCGFMYRYTCETDINMTNLNSDAFANLGGWRGGGAAANPSNPGLQSTAITAGTYRLVLHVKKATSIT